MNNSNRKISRKQAIEAKCHDCCGEYVDGKQDCENTFCSLYPYMPYGKKEPGLDWLLYSPRHKGRILLERVKSQGNIANFGTSLTTGRGYNGEESTEPRIEENTRELGSGLKQTAIGGNQ